MDLPHVYQELDIAPLDVTHVFRDYEGGRVGFIVQGEDKLAPLYVYVSDEQATELSVSFAQWLGGEDGLDPAHEGPTTLGMVYPAGAEDHAAGGS